MTEFSCIGTGDERSQKELWGIIDEYKDKFDTDEAGAELIFVELLKPERQANEYLISMYKQCIKENRTVDKVIKYDYELRDDVLY
jgi:hypothetical protein